MPAVIIPTLNSKSVAKPSRGDIFGILHATKNIDLTTNPGVIRLSNRVSDIFNSTDDDTDLEIPVSFIRTNADQTDRWWALAQNNLVNSGDGLLFKATDTDPEGGWAQDAITNTPTDACDNFEIFGKASGYDRLVVARDTDLSMLNNGTWTASWWVTTLGQSALTSANLHHIRAFTNKLLVPDGNVVHTIDDSLVVVASRLTFPDEYSVRWIETDDTYSYFGCDHVRGGVGRIFRWDGTSETYNDSFPVDSDITFAGIADKDRIMHTVNGDGKLLRFTGDGFEPVAEFPIHLPRARFNRIASGGNRSNITMNIHMNGMTIDRGKVNILFDNGTPTGSRESLPSGIWEYDPAIGLYCKNTVSKFDGSTQDSFGAQLVTKVGALQSTNDTPAIGDSFVYPLLAGAEINTDPTTTIKSIQITSTDELTQRGWFVTERLENKADFRAFWKRLLMAVNMDSSSSVIVKYRTSHDPNLPDHNVDAGTDRNITWSSTTVFAVTGSVSNFSVGDEVDVYRGVGEGQIAHISSISGSNITLDEAMTGPTNTDQASVRIRPWKKLGTISSVPALEHAIMTIAKRSKWIQFKVELRGTNLLPEIEELFAEFNPSRR